jgi:predicted DNA-binding transcriptional regulator YafY
MLEQLSFAKRECLWVKLQYFGTKDEDFQTLHIHPYELVHRNNQAYVIAYSLKVKDYRTYRIQSTRMRHVEVLNKKFQRNQDFNLKEHIGTSNVIQNETISLHLKVFGRSRRVVQEQSFGQNRRLQSHADYDELCLDLEGKESVIHYLLSLRDEVEIIEPLEIKNELREIITNMQTKYNSY